MTLYKCFSRYNIIHVDIELVDVNKAAASALRV